MVKWKECLLWVEQDGRRYDVSLMACYGLKVCKEGIAKTSMQEVNDVDFIVTSSLLNVILLGKFGIYDSNRRRKIFFYVRKLCYYPQSGSYLETASYKWSLPMLNS